MVMVAVMVAMVAPALVSLIRVAVVVPAGIRVMAVMVDMVITVMELMAQAEALEEGQRRPVILPAQEEVLGF